MRITTIMRGSKQISRNNMIFRNYPQNFSRFSGYELDNLFRMTGIYMKIPLWLLKLKIWINNRLLYPICLSNTVEHVVEVKRRE